MAGAPLVRVEREDPGVGLLVLDRPDRLNALSSDLAAALADGVTALAADDEVRAIVVAGDGKAFCAGADIAELDTLDGPHAFASFVRRLTDAFDVLASCPKPSVAAVHGVAFGGGCELALACDLRVADETARLGVPEIKLGVLPGAGGTARLPRLLPNAVAKQLLLTGEPLGAADAHRLGLVNEVVPTGQARQAAVALAARMAGLAPLALAAAKRLVDEGATLPVDGAITFERETVSMLFATEDRVEGMRAYLEKRSPSFRGR
jgi:enoyl-CoA hydratase